MRRARFGVAQVAVWALLIAAGCTRVPAVEFSAYRQAFDEARSAGEQVLLDYGASKAKFERLKQQGQGEVVRESPQRRLAFDVTEAAGKDATLDEVGVRMRAWQIVGQYNEVLTKLAEGRSASEIAPAIEGLASSLKAFPLEKLAEAAGKVSRFAGLLTIGLEQWQREASRRKFIEVVGEGAGVMPAFLELLRADAQNFANIRLGLYVIEWNRLSAQITEQKIAFERLAKQHKPQGAAEDESSIELAQQINARLTRLADYPASGRVRVTADEAGMEYTPLVHGQLTQQAARIDELAERALALEAELTAYRQVMVEYVRLLNEVERSLKALQEAASAPRAGRPAIQFEDVVRLAFRVKRALAEYREAR